MNVAAPVTRGPFGRGRAEAANMGSSTLLVTMNLQNIAQMSCNPAMGGIAKGQIVREIDALGGYSGIVSDTSAIQFKMLNKSKGPAMWSPRVQSDRMRFAEDWRLMLEQTQNLDFYQEMVTSILIKGGRCVGVKTSLGLEISARAVVLTNGTFLNGLIHIGEKNFGGGRAGEKGLPGARRCLRRSTEEGRVHGHAVLWQVCRRHAGAPRVAVVSTFCVISGRCPQLGCSWAACAWVLL